MYVFSNDQIKKSCTIKFLEKKKKKGRAISTTNIKFSLSFFLNPLLIIFSPSYLSALLCHKTIKPRQLIVLSNQLFPTF